MPRVVSLVLLIVMAWAGPATAQGRRDFYREAASLYVKYRRNLPPELAQAYADGPTIELVTMGVGALMWERHGHIALCVRYANPQKDLCYNYGIADFLHPVGMAVGFFRGTNSFWAGPMVPEEMLATYLFGDRTIWVQPLPLSALQKKQVIDKLEHDILDENRFYAYDHFWDNCTTRVRNILDDVTDHALSKMPEIDDHRTYRDLAREGFLGMRIPLLITDLAMGRVTDRVPSYWERMFLPDYLREAVATLWGVEPVAIYTRRGPPSLQELAKQLAAKGLTDAQRAAIQTQIDDIKGSPSGRVLFALFIIAITAPVWATRLWGRFERAGLAVALGPQVFLGTVFWFLAILSPLPYVRWNESCLVFLPVDLAVLWLSADRRRLYARGRLAMLGVIALLLLFGVLHQPLWAALLWPAIPLAVVGFSPARAAAGATGKLADAAGDKPAEDKPVEDKAADDKPGAKPAGTSGARSGGKRGKKRR